MNAKTKATLWATVMALSAPFNYCIETRVSAQISVKPTAAAPAAVKPLSRPERAANLFGREIISSGNQKTGRVDNESIDLESGHIRYVVVGASRGKLAVVPQVFGVSSANSLQVNISKQKLDGAPQFTSEVDKPDQLGQAGFVYNVYHYFGVAPWWQGSAPANQ